jgi:hypothetical protein
MLGVMLLGLGLCAYASIEYKRSKGSGSEPVKIDLLDIENGRISKSPYIRLGPHYRLYDAIYYRYEIVAEKGESPEHTKVTSTYYPIFSADGPVGRRMESLLRKYGGYDKIPDLLPDDERLPDDNPVVIVRTREYNTIGELPGGTVRFEKMEGMIVNWGGPMGVDFMATMRERYEDINFNKVLLFEPGRKPLSGIAAIGMVVAGLLLFAVPPIVMIRRDRAKLKKSGVKETQDTNVSSPEDVEVTLIQENVEGNPYRRTD